MNDSTELSIPIPEDCVVLDIDIEKLEEAKRIREINKLLEGEDKK